MALWSRTIFSITVGLAFNYLCTFSNINHGLVESYHLQCYRWTNLHLDVHLLTY